MAAPNPLHPLRDDGSQLDATFELRSVAVFDLIFHHKARGRNDPRALNQDYHEALATLLSRLVRLNATILAIVLDSSVARDLEHEDRVLALRFPITLNDTTDVHELRLQITRAQKPLARREDVKPGGGNDQKRIQITFRLDDPSIGPAALEKLLADGTYPGDLGG